MSDPTVIRGGTVIDGTGGPPREAHIAIIAATLKQLGKVATPLGAL